MNTDILEYLSKYDNQVMDKFNEIYELLLQSLSESVEEKLWAKLPSFYIGDNFVRIIPFKDHLNIEAKGIEQYKEELKEYKITPKGMLQIYLKQEIPKELLKQIFFETLMQ